jgi:hypothetical protein
MTKKKIFIASIFLIMTMVLSVTSCITQPISNPTATMKAREPFSARRVSGDGVVIAWSGFVNGYKNGSTEEFVITLENNTNVSWQGGYCLQLMNRQLLQVITPLGQREFNLEPSNSFSDVLTTQLPENLDEGTFDLALVVRKPGGPMVDLIPIQIGRANDVHRATTRQDIDASLEACPPEIHK